uniref:RNA helicase n=1 Tax=Romanomermis culicivorax TaxID=13658 RepID=A0A915IXA0_ROMCU
MVTLSGDPCQLGPCITSQRAEELGYCQTLLECLYNMNKRYAMLNEQNCTHPDIRSLIPLSTEELSNNDKQVPDSLGECYWTRIIGG